ncbi:DUF6036 family nucleotidyltransferase [Glutamicibacter sp.]|jgi:Domain of unknown function (DUF1814).|uniref:DUF6036 family nucleotidyltransferase n=1 Tax=Glutamicibacter sp. TaxID=1931995 RepID=UPI002B472252|nr:DUF6036 family nucleotidyltransferase [Glutamicibacter sp.]HJX77887.1 DUF6036 family nucleotidyltransferase [Glutamicibacter sp.]
MSGAGIRRFQVDELLVELDRRTGERELTLNIRIVGGSALLLHGLIDRATEDTDACYSPQAEVEEIIDAMAQEFGLPKKWLNSSAAAFIPDNAGWTAAPDPVLAHIKLADLPTLTDM